LNDGSNTAIDIIPIVDEESVQRSKRDVKTSESSSEAVNEKPLEYDSYTNKHALRKRSIENSGAYSIVDRQSEKDYIEVNIGEMLLSSMFKNDFLLSF
jgi:hypothetical protein